MENNETINLFEVGVLVNLKIGCWSGRKMVSRADFVSVGLDPDTLPSDLVNYGRKLLVNKAEIQTLTKIEQRARSYLANFSVPFGIANAHFVPIKLIPDIEENLNSYKKEFFAAVDSFITRFDKAKEEIKEKHPDFWQKCLRQHYPHTAEALRSKYHFSWFMFKISGLDSIKETNLQEITDENQRQQILKETMQHEVSGFVEQYVSQMRGEVVKFCDLMSARINGKPFGDEAEAKQLTGRSLAFFRKYIDKFRTLNVFGDNNIDKLLTDFRDQYLDLGTTSKSFDSAAMKTAVSLSLSSIRKQASLEEGEGSQFINSLKRKVII